MYSYSVAMDNETWITALIVEQGNIVHRMWVDPFDSKRIMFLAEREISSEVRASLDIRLEVG